MPLTELMDVETVESRGEVLDLSLDSDLATGGLLELDDTRHSRATVWVEDAYSVVGNSRIDHPLLCCERL